MAAPPSKPSPSQEGVGDPAPPATHNLKPPPAACAESEPTYQTSEESTHYQIAKGLLNEGDFEQALSTIEEGLEETRAKLISIQDDDEDFVSFHPSMAPFHYLYGTTLLYSIEESDSDPMTGMQQSEPPTEEAGEEEADDIQIAFENLEAARLIIEKLDAVEKGDSKFQLDLAQIYLREGDLNRINGRYEEAMSDYEKCISLRESNMGRYDRKIADPHLQLALVYSLAVAQAKEEDDQTKIDGYRKKVYYHYLQCSRAFVGQLAFLCNQDADQFLTNAENDIPKFKTAGDDHEKLSDEDHPKVTGLKLQALRRHVQNLKIPDEHQAMALDILGVLEEIQESVDEFENSEKGVHEVSEMKSAITAAIAGAVAQDNPEEGDASEVAVSGSVNAFGSAAAVASTAVAQPIMAVKKKKKRTAENAELQDAKIPAKEAKSE